MPGRPHHSEKMKKCVEHVMAKGHDESAAYAICTTSMQEAGEPIFEGAEARSPKEYSMTRTLRMRTCSIRNEDGKWKVYSIPDLMLIGTFETELEALAKEKSLQPQVEMDIFAPASPKTLEAPNVQLHLCGALGKVRTEKLNGIEHLVVPVVALMEGVIHPVNAETPEYVPASTIRRMASSFNGRPVTIGHPVKDGRQCSANEPTIMESHAIGTIYHSKADGSKLHMEAWIEKSKAQRLNQEMYQRLCANQIEEVSVGAFVVADIKQGDFNGKKYKAMWKDATGDHLALLPGGRGACSVEMGCGACRTAEAYAIAEGELRAAGAIGTTVEEPTVQVTDYVAGFTTLEGTSLDDRMRQVTDAVYDKFNKNEKNVPVPTPYAYPQVVFDDHVIVRREDSKLYSIPYTMKDGKAVLDESKQVEVKQTYTPVTSSLRANVGRRNNSEDESAIQQMHDMTMKLGAKCDRANYKLMTAKPT